MKGLQIFTLTKLTLGPQVNVTHFTYVAGESPARPLACVRVESPASVCSFAPVHLRVTLRVRLLLDRL